MKTIDRFSKGFGVFLLICAVFMFATMFFPKTQAIDTGYLNDLHELANELREENAILEESIAVDQAYAAYKQKMIDSNNLKIEALSLEYQALVGDFQ